MSRATLIGALVCAAMFSGCGSTTQAPTAPTASTVTSIAVTAATVNSAAFQLKAMASLADGSVRDVTTSASWTSSNLAVATVSSTGVVAVLANGDVEFRATYQSTTGSLRMLVTQQPVQKYALTGVVREAATNKVLDGARLVVADGTDAGQFAISNQAGAYTFPALSAGNVRLDVTKDGYDLFHAPVVAVTANATADLWIFPTPPRDAGGKAATGRCGDGSWTWTDSRVDACTGHDGLAYPVCPGPLCTESVVIRGAKR
jgi:hypothetical protein